jgi:hypothetical protein
VAEKVEVDYLFNTKSAIDNAAKLGKSFSSLTVAIGNILSSGGLSLLGKFGSAMPMVSDTLSQMGTVITNNLLRPLQATFLPLLRSLMQWVRDNRTSFLQLGTVISSAFKAGFSIAKALIGTVIDLAKSLWSTISGGGKITFNSFLNFLNLTLLKITFIFTFIQILLEPLIKGIGNLFKTIWDNAIKPFIDGFMEGFGSQLGPLFEDFLSLVSEAKALFGDLFSEGDFNWVAPLFKFIGQVIGIAFIAPLRIVIALFRGLVAVQSYVKAGIGNSLNFIKNSVYQIVNFFKAIPGQIAGFFSGIGESIVSSILNGLGSLQAKATEILSGIPGWKFALNLMDKGEPRTSPTATAGGIASNNTSVSQDIKIEVNGAQSPAATATEVQRQLKNQSSLRDQFQKAKVGKGA